MNKDWLGLSSDTTVVSNQIVCPGLVVAIGFRIASRDGASARGPLTSDTRLHLDQRMGAGVKSFGNLKVMISSIPVFAF